MSPARRFVIPGFHPLRMSGMGVDRLWLGGRTVIRPYRYGAGAAFVLGGLLIIWSGLIHFHLWQAVGYRHIPTIGPLFLLQASVGVVLGLVVVVTRRVWAAALGVGFTLGTLIGFVVTVEHGLFGFRDGWSAPFAHQALVVELLAVVLLGLAAGLCLRTSGHPDPSTGTPVDVPPARAGPVGR